MKFLEIFIMFKCFRFFLLAIILPCMIFVSCDKEEGEEPFDKEEDVEEPFDVVIDFQDVAFPDNLLYMNNSGASGFFIKDIVSFPNYYSEEWGIHYGFAFSKAHDRTTPGPENQYSVFVNESDNNVFALVWVCDPDDWSSKTFLTFSQPVRDISFDVANSTYAALAMKDGYEMAKQFGNDDWFDLLLQFYDKNNNPLFVNSNNEAEPQAIPLAQGTDIVNGWITVTIEGEAEVSKIEFTLQSSDYNSFGMITPAYFCIDNIKARTVK